jgi:hypothetical protein
MTNRTAVQFWSPGRRAAAYWFVDGLAEIYFGFLLLLPSALFAAAKVLHWQIRGLDKWWGSVLSMFALAAWYLHRPILDFLKARITYPRTGYAHPPSDLLDKNSPEYKILTLGTAQPSDDNVSSFAKRTIPWIWFWMFPMVFLRMTHWGLPVVMCGIATGIYLLHRNSVRPYSLRALLPMVLAGFITAALNLEPDYRMIAPWFICGAWLLGIGTWTLVRYLQAHPKANTGQDGRP